MIWLGYASEKGKLWHGGPDRTRRVSRLSYRQISPMDPEDDIEAERNRCSPIWIRAVQMWCEKWSITLPQTFSNGSRCLSYLHLCITAHITPVWPRQFLRASIRSEHRRWPMIAFEEFFETTLLKRQTASEGSSNAPYLQHWNLARERSTHVRHLRETKTGDTPLFSPYKINILPYINYFPIQQE